MKCRHLLVLAAFLACMCSSIGAPSRTNAYDSATKQSKGLSWLAPEVLAGEPPLTGYYLHWNTTNENVSSSIYKGFVIADTNGVPIQSELTITTNETGGITNTFLWTEYPLEIPTNGVNRVWFWVTASNSTGAVSTYSESVTITIDTRLPASVEKVERQ